MDGTFRGQRSRIPNQEINNTYLYCSQWHLYRIWLSKKFEVGIVLLPDHWSPSRDSNLRILKLYKIMVSVHVYISEVTWSHISHSMMLIIHIGDQLSNSLRKEQVVLYKYMNIYLKEVLCRLFSTSQHVRIWTEIRSLSFTFMAGSSRV